METVPAARCVKLDNDVEVIVAPKTRSSSLGPKDVFGPPADQDQTAKDVNVILELRSFPADYLSTSAETSTVAADDVILCHPSALQRLDAAWTAEKVFYLSHAIQPAQDALDDLDDQERARIDAEGSTGQRRRDDEGSKPPKLAGLYVRVKPSEEIAPDHVGVSRHLRRELSLSRFDRVR